MKNSKRKSKNTKIKNSMMYKKMKTSIENQKQYKIFESNQFLGLIFVVVFSFLFVVSIVQVSGFSTINSYTVGMLFGYYSYFIYVAFIFLGLSWLFQLDVKIDKFIAKKFNRKFHFSWLPYLFFALGMALLIESLSKAISTKTLFPGIGAFQDFFNDWWRDFTNNYGTELNSSAALPGIFNSGIIVSLFMSLITCWSGYIVSIIIGVLFIVHFVLYVLYGSIIKIIRIKVFGDPNKNDKINKQEFEEYKTKILDLDFEDTKGMIEKPDHDFLVDVEAKTTTISLDHPDNIFPIEDPFNSNKNSEQDFIEEKTTQINLEKNLTKEFDIKQVMEKNKPSNLDIETFDFELDIFKTETNSIDNEINDIDLEQK